MIVFDNVSFSYGEEKVLDNLSFTINEGEEVGLIGANGAGKSTLMRALLGLIKVDGKITVDGKEVCKENLAYVRSKLGYVIQDSDNQMFMPTVLEDMIFGPVNYGKSKEEAIAIAERVLTQMDMLYIKERANHKMSGGEKRMAAIATILAMEPKGLLLDEPSTALDPANRRQVINTLNSLKITKLIASHDLDMILETCDRVILISDGKVRADGDAMTILSDKKLLEENHLELPFCLSPVPQRRRNMP